MINWLFEKNHSLLIKYCFLDEIHPGQEIGIKFIAATP